MNSMRKVLSCFMAAIVLAAFALPSGATHTGKLFYAVFPDVVPSGNATQVTVSFHNESPGVSTINSLKIVAPVNVAITAIAPGTLSGPYPEAGTSPPRNYWVVTNFPGIKTGKFQNFTVTVNNTSPNCTSATWGAFANTGNSYPGGDDFAPVEDGRMTLTSGVGCDGILKCPSLPTTASGIYNFTDSSGGNSTTGFRWENKDASACIPVVFNVAFSESNKTVLIEWDTNTQPYATLETTTTWPRELVDPATGLPRPTKVAWEVIGGTPKYVPGPACLSSDPPLPYGTLAAAITNDATTIMIAAASLPAPPFPIVIASNVQGRDPERMLVKTFPAPVGGIYTATVERATGGTLPSTHSNGAKVVSTPLPTISPNAKLPIGSVTPHPYAGEQALVCIIEENFLAQSNDDPCPAQAAGAEPLGCVQTKTRFFLIGDPYVSRGE